MRSTTRTASATTGPCRSGAALGARPLLAAARTMLAPGEPSVVLLCACSRRAGCHREEVAAVLVRHLGTEDMGELHTRSGTDAPASPPAQLGRW